MLDWLKRFMGNGTGELSEEQARLLAEDLTPLDSVRGGLAERAHRYVATGEGEEVLAELAGLDPKGPRPLSLLCNDSSSPGSPSRTALLKRFERGPARAIHRLALVWEAASRPRGRSMRLPAGTVPAWLEILLQESTFVRLNAFQTVTVPGPLALDLLEEVLAAAGEPRNLIPRALLGADPKHFSFHSTMKLLKVLPGWKEALDRSPGAVREALAFQEPERRAHALGILREADADPSPFASEIAEAATQSSKQVREQAAALAGKIPEAVRPRLEEIAVAGNAEERLQAVTLLIRLAPAASEELLRRRLEEEKSEKVKAAIRESFARPEAAPAGPEFELPPLPPLDLETPPGPEVRQALEELYRTDDEEKRRWHEQALQRVAEMDDGEKKRSLEQSYRNKTPRPRTREQINAVFGLLRTLTWGDPIPGELRIGGSCGGTPRFLALPGLRLLHAIRLMFLEEGRSEDRWYSWSFLREISQYYAAHTPRFDLRELAAVLQAVGRGESDVEDMLLDRNRWVSLDHGLEPESVWPFFASRLEVLEKALAPPRDIWAEARFRDALEVLATFPRPPQRLLARLWDIALNGTKKDRPLAQNCVERDPGRDDRLTAALAGPKAETRAAAAEWLGRLGDAQAIPALRAALAKEKQEAAAGSMMVALERLGVPAAEIADLDGLLAEARKMLKKEVPAGLSWFPFATLPALHWRESGAPAEPEIARWMVLQSHRLGSPEPGPRLRHLASLFRREDAEALGQFVLEAWIGHDTLGHTPEEAHAHAAREAPQTYRTSLSYPQYFPKQQSEEAWYQQYYNAKLTEPRGSAIKEKGVLAVAGACCGARAAAPVERYLKRWYGMRVAHCRALLAMLSWVDDRAAVQVILATATRFRTRTIREEAERLVRELAERKGWTVDQLADRTIPTAGFDERCELTLDYGGRTFTARLAEDWSVVLVNEEGKTVKALPDPRQDDDADKAKAAKKLLAEARKEVQAVLRQQRDRLYEALCTQRSWAFEDWDEFLHRHPLVGRYCQRLIWSVYEGDALTATFRPLEDGSLTDAGDDEVTVSPEATVRLLHSAVVPAEAVEAWRRHLADYRTEPLFSQLGEPWRLPEALRDETELAEFRGYLLEAFALRGRATKLGYSRGPAEDGGVFSIYQKHFPGLGMTAVVEFTGNQLPETNRTVALTTLSFERNGGAVAFQARGGVPLREVPPVLLSECRNDLAALAAQGPGYDPEWEKKAAW